MSFLTLKYEANFNMLQLYASATIIYRFKNCNLYFYLINNKKNEAVLFILNLQDLFKFKSFNILLYIYAQILKIGIISYCENQKRSIFQMKNKSQST